MAAVSAVRVAVLAQTRLPMPLKWLTGWTGWLSVESFRLVLFRSVSKRRASFSPARGRGYPIQAVRTRRWSPLPDLRHPLSGSCVTPVQYILPP
jgi:hypothetical protein